MASKILFGRWEAVTFLVSLMVTQVVLGFPRLMLEAAGDAGWMLSIYVSLLAFLAFYIITRLYKPFHGKDLLDIAEIAGGRILKVVLGFLFLGYLLYIISIVLREFSEDMKVIILPQTPISIIALFFLAGITFGVYKGIEPIVRFSAYIIPVFIAGFFIITLATVKHYDYTNFLPVLGPGPVQIFGNGALKVSVYSAISILFFLTPFLRTHQNFRIVGYSSLGITAIIFLWGVVSYSLVYPFPLGQENFLPVYQMSRLVSYGRFFQRIESIFVLIWAAIALMYLSGGFFFIVYIFRKSFSLEYHRPVILPFAILIYTFSLLPPNLLSAVELETRYFRNYIWILTFAIPILVLSAANLRYKHKEGDRKK